MQSAEMRPSGGLVTFFSARSPGWLTCMHGCFCWLFGLKLSNLECRAKETNIVVPTCCELVLLNSWQGAHFTVACGCTWWGPATGRGHLPTKPIEDFAISVSRTPQVYEGWTLTFRLKPTPRHIASVNTKHSKRPVQKATCAGVSSAAHGCRCDL